jgi:hypothetical protein
MEERGPSPAPPSPPPSLWKFLWTKRRGFLIVHGVIALVLVSVLVLNLLFADATNWQYRNIAFVLLLFQAVAFTLDSLWSMKDQRERERRRREQASQPEGEDDGFW